MIDVVIIGAGPAGTAAAFDLLSQGFSVLLLDKYGFPRKKACAGGITPKARALFKYDISSIIQRECSSIKIWPNLGRAFLIQDEKPLCYMTQRWELDLFSLEMVQKKAGQFQVVKKIVSIEEKKNHLEIRTSDQLIKSRYLIGADGANSVVRRLTHPVCRVRRYPALEADIRVDCPELFPMEFDFSMPGKGYYWVFPKKNHLNIGIYSTTGQPALKQGQLVEYAQKRFGTDRLQAIKGYSIGVGGYSYCPGQGRVLLSGDAAGFGESLLGEGIYFALKSGQAAAQAIISSCDTGIFPGIAYAKEIKKIRTDLWLYHFSAKCLYSFPRVSLKLLSHPFFHGRFAKGYADGKTMAQILFCR
ncbi:MAG: geranylgeranyl reductase family protein [Desulfobacteraceae bacterium]|nr:geranylgeranyl reductase family protein [Desulfobacteraceae bacterium]